MVFFNKKIVDSTTTNPIVITTADFSGGAITDFVLLYPKKIHIAVIKDFFSPTSIKAQISGNGSVTISNVAVDTFVNLVYKGSDTIFSYFEGGINEPIKFAAATTTITMTLKSEQNVTLVNGTHYYMINLEWQIMGK